MEWPPKSVADVALSLLYCACFGLLGIGLSVLGFKVFDWLTPRVHVQEELAEKHNIAVAIVCGAVIIGISLIVVAAIHS